MYCGHRLIALWTTLQTYNICTVTPEGVVFSFYQSKSTVGSGLAARLHTIRPGQYPDSRLLGLAQVPYISNFFFAFLDFIFYFSLFIFFIIFPYLIFLYGKEEINLWYFFILYKSWVMIIYFSFEAELNFLIKAYLFLSFKNALKKFDFFKFF